MSTKTRAAIAGALTFVTISVATVSGQTCNTKCSIRIQKETTLSSRDVTAVPSMSVSVVRLETGEYFVSYPNEQPIITKFKSDGSVVTRYEREGSGPGEMKSAPLLFHGRGDTIVAFADGRAIKLSPQLDHLGTVKYDLRPYPLMITLPDGSIVVNARLQTTGGWYMFGRMSSAGRALGQYERVALDKSGGTMLLARSPASGGFWSMRSTGSTLKKWSAAGEEVGALSIQRTWFQPWDTAISGEPYTVKPRPQTSAVYEVNPSLLLVLTKTPDAGWRSFALNSGRGGLTVNPAAIPQSAIYDTLLELVDATTGRVLTSTTVPESLLLMHGPGLYATSTRAEGDGNIAIDVWSIAIGGVK